MVTKAPGKLAHLPLWAHLLLFLSLPTVMQAHWAPASRLFHLLCMLPGVLLWVCAQGWSLVFIYVFCHMSFLQSGLLMPQPTTPLLFCILYSIYHYLKCLLMLFSVFSARISALWEQESCLLLTAISSKSKQVICSKEIHKGKEETCDLHRAGRNILGSWLRFHIPSR